MLQTIPSEDPSCPLLVFYDSGCSTAVLSDRAHYSLNPIVVSNGPTAVDVAGGKTIMIPYGDERFHLQIEDGDRVKATITGLRMPHVTTPFPLVKLKEAWLDLCDHAKNVQPNLCLPTIDAEVRGREVDILLGIKYVKYFPAWFTAYLEACRSKEQFSSLIPPTRPCWGVRIRHGAECWIWRST